jgi:roadblock/LC7 domain-containing protein
VKNFTLLALCAMLLVTSKLWAQPMTAAPTPTTASGNVISLFSGAYTDVAGTDWFPNWGQSTQVTDIMVAGNATKQYTNLNYQGVQFASGINASAMQNLHLDIWTPNCTAFEVYLINTSPSTVEKKYTINPTLSGWNSVDIPLSSFQPEVRLTNITQIKLVGTPFGTSTVYLDNIYFWSTTTPPTISNFTVPAKNQSDGPFMLTAPTSNSSGAFTYTSSNTSVATVSGSTVTIVGSGTSVIVATQAAAGGFGSGGIEANLVVASNEPSVAAPTPTKAAGDVISLYSNAYTNVSVGTWSAVWDNADVADVTIAGNDNKKYTNLTFAGVEFTSPTVNASTMSNFHLDVWTANAAEFKVKLVDFGPNGVYNGPGSDDSEHELTFAPTLNSWYAIDVPLSSFTGMTGRTNVAQMILVATGGGKTVWVDNVYFWKSSAPTEPTIAATTPTRSASQVVASMFSGAYTDVSGINWNPGWGQTTVYSEVMIAGNATKKYAALNYQGAEPATPINATAASHLHIDFWAATTTNFRVKLVDFGPNGVYGLVGDDSEHEVDLGDQAGGSWQSLDIPLSSFTGLTSRSKIGQFIISSTSTSPTIWLDNIYFYNTAVPVELVNFTATKDKNKAVLSWKVASEINNKGFEIERSTNVSTWKTIDFVKGKGTTTETTVYSATDATPSVGINYYRLKQVDFDGKFEYSPVQSVNFDGANKGTVKIFPNPTADVLTVDLGETLATPTTYSIVNVMGQVVKTGTLTPQIAVSELGKGVYWLSFNQQAVRFVVQ